MEIGAGGPGAVGSGADGSDSIGSTERLLGDAAKPPLVDTAAQESNNHNAWKMLGCFVGLQASYLTWGVMQEKIMTTHFEPTPLVPDGLFPSATFCVFSNRVLAIVLAMALCYCYHGSLKIEAPLWYFTPCALSNTTSSWAQYAALKFVSFPMQVLFKSAKVIPVMMVGKFMNGASFPWIEYFEAVAITTGVSLFSLSKSSGGGDGASTELSGLFMLTMYITSDAFTSQWQDRIYKAYPGKIDQYQMMFGVNVSATVLTVAALVLSGEVPLVLEFLLYNPRAFFYNVVTAIASATGQMFIFYTIKNFGPVVFTIIMTTRQMISMVISTILFGHPLSFGSYVGAFVVFGAVFYRIRRKHNEKKAKKASNNGSKK